MIIFFNGKWVPYWFHSISVSFFVRSALSLSKPPQICEGANCWTGSLMFATMYYLLGGTPCSHCYWYGVFFFCVLSCQLKSCPELYAGYVPMAYSDYLKKMSKYVHICLCYTISDNMVLSKSSCLLIALCVDVLGAVNGEIMSRYRLLQIGYEEINNFYLTFALPINFSLLKSLSIWSYGCLFPWFASEECFRSFRDCLEVSLVICLNCV